MTVRKWLLGAVGYGAGYVAGYARARLHTRPSAPAASPAPPVASAPADPCPLRCGTCGSDQIHATAWINVNTNELVGGESPTNQLWCAKCETAIDWSDLLGASQA